MLWPDVANKLAHDHPVLAALFFCRDMFWAMLVAEARRGGEMERQRGVARVEAETEEGFSLEGGPWREKERPRKCNVTADAHQHGMWSSTETARVDRRDPGTEYIPPGFGNGITAMYTTS